MTENIILDQAALDALDGQEIDSDEGRELLFTTSATCPRQATDAVCNTLDLIIQGLALDGLVDLDHYNTQGLHRCSSCGQVYYGEATCPACEHEHATTAEGEQGEEQDEAQDEEQGEPTEIQIVALSRLQVSDIQLLNGLPGNRLDDLEVDSDYPLIAANGGLSTSGVLKQDDGALAQLLVACVLPELPESVWAALEDRIGQELQIAVLRDCAPKRGVTALEPVRGGKLFWDLDALNDLTDYELACLYVAQVRPGISIPDYVQAALRAD